MTKVEERALAELEALARLADRIEEASETPITISVIAAKVIRQAVAALQSAAGGGEADDASESRAWQTAPKQIWLQIDTDSDDYSEPCPDPAGAGISWCWEQIGGVEIRYVRADLAASQPAVDVAGYIAKLERRVEGFRSSEYGLGKQAGIRECLEDARNLLTGGRSDG